MQPLNSVNELKNIINNQQLTPVYQPIVQLSEENIFAHEALIRGPVNSDFHLPKALFKHAADNDLLAPLELTCREISCRHFAAADNGGKLFLNVSPMSLLEPGYINGTTNRILEQLHIDPRRVVIEISEQYPLDDYQLIRNATDHYRNMGFEIAIDDLGAGYAGLRSWSEIRPEYVKVDRHFIHNINNDAIKYRFVECIQQIARDIGCRVIAEGVETTAELAAVRDVGIDLCQGYLLGKPKPPPFSNVASQYVSIKNNNSLKLCCV